MKLYIKFNKGKLRKFVLLALKKAGSERKLTKLLNWPLIAIYRYKLERINISNLRLRQLLGYIGLDYKNIIFKENPILLNENWGRIIGGINCFRKKLKNNTFKHNHRLMREASSKLMKKWHKKFRVENPEQYYRLQYERFKKISHIRVKTKCGILVRNKFEEKVADWLYERGINFEYEPYLNLNCKAYFPDFVIGKTLVEVTAWKDPDHKKLSYLARKLKDYRKAGFKANLLIPTKLRKSYKPLNRFLITDLSQIKRSLGSSDVIK